jgi:hypothetical protein
VHLIVWLKAGSSVLLGRAQPLEQELFWSFGHADTVRSAPVY